MYVFPSGCLSIGLCLFVFHVSVCDGDDFVEKTRIAYPLWINSIDSNHCKRDWLRSEGWVKCVARSITWDLAHLKHRTLSLNHETHFI